MNEKKITIEQELKELHKDYYILLDTSLLGNKGDIIRCVSTKTYSTQYIKADGTPDWFAASIEWGLQEKWFVPFSHKNFAKFRTAKTS